MPRRKQPITETICDAFADLTPAVQDGVLITLQAIHRQALRQAAKPPLQRHVEQLTLGAGAAAPTLCDECNGSRARVYPDTPIGQTEICRACGGSGSSIPSNAGIASREQQSSK
jgi:hypothetical protein